MREAFSIFSKFDFLHPWWREFFSSGFFACDAECVSKVPGKLFRTLEKVARCPERCCLDSVFSGNFGPAGKKKATDLTS